MLRKLIAEEIDPVPAIRRHLVSALLLGGNVTVKKGEDAGGDFKNIPACRAPRPTQCAQCVWLKASGPALAVPRAGWSACIGRV